MDWRKIEREVSRPPDVVHLLADRDLQALDLLTGEKVPTVGRHHWDLGRLDVEDVEMHQLGPLHQLHPGMKAGWDRLGSQLCQSGRQGGRRPLLDACEVDDALEEEEESLAKALPGRLDLNTVDRPVEDGWAHDSDAVLRFWSHELMAQECVS